ncbi:MAG TPA: adenosylcobinamide-GDP ribazoletransferase [Anaeromyxobacter sp.]|nr:adenosylcobinamide-GDP ribazoletransferase [Anaeromyxobacter sp.]
MPAPLRHLAAALRFLTRLPVPGPPLDARDLGRALAFFPVAGAALGALVAGTGWLLAPRLAPGVLAVLLVALLAALSGGLHLDGLADVADGLGGGHGDRARTLAIMRDSRIGAFGAAALVLLLLVKVAAVAELLGRGGAEWALLCAPVLGRTAAVPLVVLFPYARPEGLGRAFHEGGGPRELLVAGGLCLVTLCAAAATAAGLRAFLPAAAGLGAAVLVALACRRRLGGLTGDVYGAAIELAEAAFLLTATARPWA